MTSLRALGNKSPGNSSVRVALIIFVTMRIFLSAWAIVALALNPLPDTPDEVVRPYLGQPRLVGGAAGLLLGPWQRFDTQRYMHIAKQGYALEENSVFPPLYPIAVRMVGYPFGGSPVAHLIAGIAIANLSLIGLLMLLHKVVSAETDPGSATRTVVYLMVFPTGFRYSML